MSRPKSIHYLFLVPSTPTTLTDCPTGNMTKYKRPRSPVSDGAPPPVKKLSEGCRERTWRNVNGIPKHTEIVIDTDTVEG
ncbi:hypothetical protein K440DRAFT_630767 [Wilcoxina mikolae CBS 423.85]|nr:hypothetical protein K440DRAFT_630767 [Wilcoxina mikolae CBS 423.85]